jgi:hypothetical protein
MYSVSWRLTYLQGAVRLMIESSRFPPRAFHPYLYSTSRHACQALQAAPKAVDAVFGLEPNRLARNEGFVSSDPEPVDFPITFLSKGQVIENPDPPFFAAIGPVDH